MSKKHKVIWGLSMSIVAIVLVAQLSSPMDWWPLFKKEPPPNHYAKFLTLLNLKGMEVPGLGPNKTETEEDCPEPSLSTDKPSPPLTTECGELRMLQPKDKIKQAVDDLRSTKQQGNLAVSLMFVVPPSDRHWLKKDFTDFAFGNIVAKRDTLRKLFNAFVANSSNALDTPCNFESSKRPYLALACRVSEEAKKTTTQPLQKPEWDTLPFFSKNDVLRVKSLSNVADTANEFKVIESKPDDTVLKKLCLLTKEQEVIQAGIDYEMKEDNIGDADVKKMTEAVLKFVGEVKNIIKNCH